MALTIPQKKAILTKLAKGATGSQLAREYGVSPSYISKLKKDASLTVAAPVAPNKPAAIKVVAETTAESNTFTCIVSSNKTTNKKIVLKVGATFGELITKVDESGSLEGVFKDVKSSEKTRVKQNKDVIPAVAGQEYHVYLMPLKANSGGIN
jgi:predicted DNA binding protein